MRTAQIALFREPVVSKLKCPVLLASEMSGFGFTSFNIYPAVGLWECGKVRLLFGLTFPSRGGKRLLLSLSVAASFPQLGLRCNGPPHADQK
jgi:hypothetical protein